jgi:DnaJ-domain-containing protein 1
MAAKVEIEVVATWRDLREVFRAIGEEERVRALREGIVGRPSAETLVERLQLGKAVKASLEAQRARCREAILSVLTSSLLTRDHRVHEVMDDSMILNGAFLMDRHQEGAFDAQVKALDLRFHGSIHFRCVGPLPPYSFSTLEVSRVPSEGVRAACQILGLSEGASLAYVKAAHRRLAHQYHPDRAPEAQERFRAISQAYRLLAECCQKGRLPSDGEEEVIFIKEFRPAGGHRPKGT